MEVSLSKGEKTRREIRSAAYELFIEQGYHGTSMRQIADSAGIALGGIYNHFPGKEEIFTDVLLNYHPIHDLLPAIEGIDGQTVDEAVHRAGHVIQKHLTERQDFIKLLFVELVEFRAKHASSIFGTLFPKALAIAQTISNAKGQLRTRELPVLTIGFLGMMFGYFVVRSFLHQMDVKIMELPPVDRLIQVYLYGILAEDPQGSKA